MTFYLLFQLKPDPGQAGGIVTHSLGHQEQQVLMTVDSRFGSPGGDRMVPTQVSCPLIKIYVLLFYGIFIVVAPHVDCSFKWRTS
jgi:hypothetical protein